MIGGISGFAGGDGAGGKTMVKIWKLANKTSVKENIFVAGGKWVLNKVKSWFR